MRMLVPSGDMYIGVPVILLRFVLAIVTPALVFPCFAKTLAAPKSEYLIFPTASSRISNIRTIFSGRTFWLDIAMHHSFAVEVGKTLQHFPSVHLNDGFICNSSMLQQVRQTSSLTKLHETIHLVTMHLNPIIFNNIRMFEH